MLVVLGDIACNAVKIVLKMSCWIAWALLSFAQRWVRLGTKQHCRGSSNMQFKVHIVVCVVGGGEVVGESVLCSRMQCEEVVPKMWFRVQGDIARISQKAMLLKVV